MTARILTPSEKERERSRRRSARQNEQAIEAAAGKRAAGISSMGVKAISRDELAARLREIPPDTRDFTARFFGDPLPGRSALDRKRMGEGA